MVCGADKFKMLGIIGIAAFFGVGLAVSIRLLLQWRQTRGIPELMCGLGLLGIGPLGFCVMMIGPLFFRDTAAAASFRSSGILIQSLGLVCTAVFTWRVFRPYSPWARALAAVFCVGLLTTGVAVATMPISGVGVAPQWHIGTWMKIACLGWCALESLRHWRVARQRLAIGIGDPVVSASFFMWGVGTGSGTLGFILIYAAQILREPGQSLGAGIQLALSLCGIVAAIALFLAFFPPKAYARFVEGRPTTSEAAH